MPCYTPLSAWRTTENTANGKKAIVFKKSANSTTPLTLPCGQCIGCRTDRAQSWAIRCTQEGQLHQQNSFITLTYNSENLPTDGSLIGFHFTDFMKRLRSHYYPQTIRYFMCAEYGENFDRPHFHACLFGLDFLDKEPIKESEGLILYNSPQLDSIWGKGYTSIGALTFETAAYTARYITKKITGKGAPDHYTTTCEHTGALIHLTPEFARMSLRPAVGKQWLQHYLTDLYPSDFAIHKGKQIKIPRYYDKIMELNGYDIETIKRKRKLKARKHLKDNTPERLAVREKCHTLKSTQLTRNYENEA
nr:MAG: replication initiation protein [Microvirus sp.]